uniref:RRM domain-containing protein n=1 Tax=Macaca nemestrina TaxID=9545 RepID=A0A2K6BDR1_MACNE
MAASAKKKNKKGKTISLTDFLAEDGGTGGGSTYVSKPVSWADETDDLEGDVSTTWHSNDDDVYRAPPIDRSILPTAPRAAREPNIDRSRLPKSPPYTAFLGNLPYDVTEESIKEFFRGLNSLGNRRIRVDVADQAQDKDRDDRSFGRDRNRDSDKTDTDWRARPATDSFDDYPPRRGDDSFGDRYDRRDDRSWSSRDDYSRDDYRRDDRGPPQRPKLNLKPRSTPKEDDSSASTSQSSRAASIFGGAKPVDTVAREREVEERLQKEQEKLQRQLDEPKLERRPRERHPSWRSEETQERERSRTGSESSQTGTSATSGRNPRRRESEKSLENETLNKEEDCHSPTSKPPKPDQPLKVMPAPPPKENAWVKRSSNPPARSQSSDTEQQSPTSGGGKVAPAQPSEEGPARKDENKVDGMNVPKGQTGTSSRGPGDGGNKDHWKESDRKDGKKDQDSRSAPEPKKPEENPASKFSSASKYAALSVDGEDENEGEDYAE